MLAFQDQGFYLTVR